MTCDDMCTCSLPLLKLSHSFSVTKSHPCSLVKEWRVHPVGWFQVWDLLFFRVNTYCLILVLEALCGPFRTHWICGYEVYFIQDCIASCFGLCKGSGWPYIKFLSIWYQITFMTYLYTPYAYSSLLRVSGLYCTQMAHIYQKVISAACTFM